MNTYDVLGFIKDGSIIGECCATNKQRKLHPYFVVDAMDNDSSTVCDVCHDVLYEVEEQE